MPTRIVPFWSRLSVRMAGVITLITAVTLGAFALIATRAHERRLIDQVVRGAALFSETIKSSTYHDMLLDRRDEAYLIMDTIGRQEGIEVVRIFNKEGRITFSTDRSEIGSLVDKNAESCYACHAANQPLERLTIPSRWRQYQRGDHQVLGMVTPIYNEPSCSNAACHVHPASQSVLGVADIGMSLTEVEASVVTLRRATTWLTALAVVLLAGLVWFIERRFVVQPIAEVVRGTGQIASGDLTARLAVRRGDELGVLASAFNQMAESLDDAQEQLSQLMENLEHLVDERTAALRQTQAQLVQSEKLSSLGRLAVSVAHEINNPLSGILTYAKLIIRTLETREVDEKTRATSIRQLRLVERETERCTAIVRNLLEFARQRPLSVADVSVPAVLDEALALLAHQISLQNVKIEKHYEPVPPVEGDGGQLRQAFVNIALNACDAMPEGGVLRVSLRPATDGEQVVVEFSDTGTGIPPDVLSKILDPFFTTKENGTGLGLSVVYGIVERHGGKLDIESQPGRGTTVRIQLAGARVPAGAART
jgi:two-component system NtrC family sensor kinase